MTDREAKFPPCPTPRKKKYAVDQSARMRRHATAKWRDKPVKSYKCKCGYFHLTSLPLIIEDIEASSLEAANG